MEKPAPQLVPDPGVVQIRGARQNNLKGIDLDLPLGKLNVINGSEILLGSPFIFTKDNIKDFDF